MIFDIDNMDIKIEKEYKSPFGKSFEYTYNGKRYFYKKSKKGDSYNELIAEKIAKKLGLPCCHYILTFDEGMDYLSSEMFDTTNYISLHEVLEDVYGIETKLEISKDDNIEILDKSKNNLEDIWNALEIKFGTRDNGQEIVSKLMYQIVKVFLFDVIIANSDRHVDNLGFIDDGVNVTLAPLFDNDYMLSEYSIYDNDYSMCVEPQDFFLQEEYVNNEDSEEPPNTLEKFLEVSSTEYKEQLNEMLYVISRESLEEIFDELESEDVIINKIKREQIINKFEMNSNIIKNIIAGKKTI